MAVDDSEPIQWRRDGSSSRTVRLLWSLGVGTFLAAGLIIVFWRLFDLTGQTGGQSIVVAAFAGLIVTILVLAFASDTRGHLERASRRLPVGPPSERSVDRAVDAALGMLAMAAIIVALMGIGRVVSQRELLELGAGPFTLLAALTIPLALVALALASFLSSVGTLDQQEEVIYLYGPDQAIDLAQIVDASSRRVGDVALLRLEYAQPDGEYVPGPRWIVVPPAVAREVSAILEQS